MFKKNTIPQPEPVSLRKRIDGYIQEFRVLREKYPWLFVFSNSDQRDISEQRYIDGRIHEDLT